MIAILVFSDAKSAAAVLGFGLAMWLVLGALTDTFAALRVAGRRVASGRCGGSLACRARFSALRWPIWVWG